MIRSLLTLFFLPLSLFAKDFGVVGETFPIKERSLLDVIRERVDQISDEEKCNIHQRVIDRYKRKLTRPRSLNLSETEVYSAHLYDPSVTVNADIKDTNDNLIVKKGTKYNPLKNQLLNQNLLFINGDDPDQILWAKRQKGMWILVKGSPIELEEKEKRLVFFDQRGVLSQKFKIESVPARVSQEGLFLKVEMVPKGERL